MLAALLWVALAQAPAAAPSTATPAPPPAPLVSAPDFDLAVLAVVKPRAITPELAWRAAESVRSALVSAGYTALPTEELKNRLGRQDPSSCQNNLTCFALVGRSIGAPAVIRVEGGVVETDLALALQAIRSEDGVVLAEGTVVTRTDADDATMQKDVASFVAKLSAAFPPATRLKMPELSARTNPQNATGPASNATPSPDTSVTSPGPSRPMWPLAPAAAGVVAIGVGAVLLGQAGSTYHQLTDAPAAGQPKLSRGEYLELQSRGNLEQTFGWALVGVGAVAAGTGAYLYFQGSNGENATVTAGPGGVSAQGAF